MRRIPSCLDLRIRSIDSDRSNRSRFEFDNSVKRVEGVPSEAEVRRYAEYQSNQGNVSAREEELGENKKRGEKSKLTNEGTLGRLSCRSILPSRPQWTGQRVHRPRSS